MTDIQRKQKQKSRQREREREKERRERETRREEKRTRTDKITRKGRGSSTRAINASTFVLKNMVSFFLSLED